MAITLRQESQAGATTKGSALTFSELDNNFIHFLTNGITVVGDDSTGKEITLGNSVKFNGGDNVTVTVDEDSSAQGATVVNIAASTGDVVNDTSPQLGGNLDVNGNQIVSTSNGNVTVAPNGSGKLVVNNSKIEVFDDESAVDFTNYGGATVLLQDAGLGTTVGLTQAAVGPESGGDTGTYPDNIHYFIANLDTSDVYDYADSSTVNGDIAYAFGYNFSQSRSEMYAGGGPLNITAYGTNADSYALKAIQLAGSQVNAQSELIFDKTYKETITTLTDDSSTSISIDCSATSVSTFSLNDAKDFVFTNLATGRSHTLILTNRGSHTATFSNSDSTAVKFPGGAPTVTSGDGKIDVITVFNDGTNLLGNIAQDFS